MPGLRDEPADEVITGCDSLQILQQAMQTATSFKPLSESETSALLGKTAESAHNGQFEEYKTTHNFDGTYQNP